MVIVSEETGAISIAEHGRLEHDISRPHFRTALASRLEAPLEKPEKAEKPDAAEADQEQSPDGKQAA